jgi:hypothetical protein
LAGLSAVTNGIEIIRSRSDSARHHAKEEPGSFKNANFGRRRAAEEPVSVGEASEAPNDVAVPLGGAKTLAFPIRTE